MTKLSLGPASLNYSGGKCYAACNSADGKNRYHIWLDSSLRHEKDRENRIRVFKNGGFRTERLAADKGAGKAVAEYLLAAAPGLLAGALAKKAEEEAEREAKQQAAIRQQRIEAAAQALFDALVEIRSVVGRDSAAFAIAEKAIALPDAQVGT